jgi:hypothetical protein
MITPAQVKVAEYILESSGIVEILQTELTTDLRGRKPNVDSIRLYLLGTFLSVHHDGKAAISKAAKVLVKKICLEDQIRLGVRQGNDAAKQLSFDFYNVTRKISIVLGYGNSVTNINDDERLRRHRVNTQIADRMMDVFQVGPRSPMMAIDATGFWAWARGKAITLIDALITADNAPINNRRRWSTNGFDQDANWGKKTGKDGTPVTFFGYEEHTLVQVPDDDESADAAPRLIVRFEVAPANEEIVDVTLDLLNRAPHPITDIIVDNHYHFKAFNRWGTELAKRGIRQHHDLRSDEHGFIEYGQMRWAAGRAHCPATPDTLGRIIRPGPTETDPALHEAFHRSIEIRKTYTMRRINLPQPDGAQRLQCPALAGHVGCPLRPGTEAAAIAQGIPIITKPPDANGPEPLPACCTQQTVKVTPPDKVLKLDQQHYWGSKKWANTYRKRTYVEGSYGNRKNDSTENMSRGLFHVTGLPLINIAMTMVNASYNLRMIQNWQERTNTLPIDHPLLQSDDDIVGFRFIRAGDSAA